MKTRLKLAERILLPGILPERATFEIGIVVSDIRKKIAVTQEEVKRVDMKTLKSGAMQWDEAKDRALEFEFTDAEIEIIRGSLEKASKENQLPTDPAMIKMYRDLVVNADKETKQSKKIK